MEPTTSSSSTFPSPAPYRPDSPTRGAQRGTILETICRSPSPINDPEDQKTSSESSSMPALYRCKPRAKGPEEGRIFEYISRFPSPAKKPEPQRFEHPGTAFLENFARYGEERDSEMPDSIEQGPQPKEQSNKSRPRQIPMSLRSTRQRYQSPDIVSPYPLLDPFIGSSTQQHRRGSGENNGSNKFVEKCKESIRFAAPTETTFECLQQAAGPSNSSRTRVPMDHLTAAEADFNSKNDDESQMKRLMAMQMNLSLQNPFMSHRGSGGRLQGEDVIQAASDAVMEAIATSSYSAAPVGGEEKEEGEVSSSDYSSEDEDIPANAGQSHNYHRALKRPAPSNSSSSSSNSVYVYRNKPSDNLEDVKRKFDEENVGLRRDNDMMRREIQDLHAQMHYLQTTVENISTAVRHQAGKSDAHNDALRKVRDEFEVHTARAREQDRQMQQQVDNSHAESLELQAFAVMTRRVVEDFKAETKVMQDHIVNAQSLQTVSVVGLRNELENYLGELFKSLRDADSQLTEETRKTREGLSTRLTETENRLRTLVNNSVNDINTKTQRALERITDDMEDHKVRVIEEVENALREPAAEQDQNSTGNKIRNGVLAAIEDEVHRYTQRMLHGLRVELNNTQHNLEVGLMDVRRDLRLINQRMEADGDESSTVSAEQDSSEGTMRDEDNETIIKREPEEEDGEVDSAGTRSVAQELMDHLTAQFPNGREEHFESYYE
ncbi:hypothetical protein F5Y16DRAFT_367216 [Xylariaceae sp. FL0255]|nr:hypothetical protein F5Y16DRAFT_367216 [Xylariaceae sp. FL0255]